MTPLMNILYDRNLFLGKELFSRLGNAKPCDTRTLTRNALKTTDLLFVRSTHRIDNQLLQDTPVRFVGSGVAGTDHIDFEALRRLNITVSTAPGCNAESVADFVMAALLEIGHRRQTSWEGKTLGIVGVGHVGKIVKRFAEEALGMKTLCCDPPRKSRGEFGTEAFVSFEELLPQADVLTFHTPLTTDGPCPTVGLFSGPIVRKVKPGAVLINFARGPICDNRLLVTMLGAGLLSDAAIDCWEGEPNYDADLAQLAILTTPHIAGHAYEGKANGTVMIYRDACRFLAKEPGDIPDFPPAPVPELTLNCTERNDEEILHEAVLTTCDIVGDDRRFRQAFAPDDESRMKAFDDLRKTYPHRRLFSATILHLAGASETLTQKLAALGFIIGTAAKKPAAKKPAAKKPKVKKLATQEPVADAATLAALTEQIALLQAQVASLQQAAQSTAQKTTTKKPAKKTAAKKTASKKSTK